MQELSWKEEVLQVIQWLEENEAFQEAFFQDREQALAELSAAGFPVSARAKRFLTDPDRVQADNLDQMKQTLTRGEKGPPSSRPFPLAEEEVSLISAEGKPPERIVNTGFADEQDASTPIPPTTTLQVDTPYFFWLEVGERIAGSIEVEDVELPIDKLPPEALLHVALFAFEGELEIIPGQDVGQIRVTPEGRVEVAQPVAAPASLAGSALMRRRLFFPVRTPAAAGAYRLRCNIYHQQTLVQAREITAVVSRVGREQAEAALTAEVDYTLSKTLDTHQLQGMGEGRLSIMLNDNGNGTHGFRFFGEDEFKNDASFDGGELQHLIEMARGAMRKATWGDEEPYQSGKQYQYSGGVNESRLKSDLVRFAIRGYRFYDALINRLAGDANRAWDLADLMLKPGQVQIAGKQSARLVIPAAIFYDYPLDDGRRAADYSLCPTFLDGLRKKTPLLETACFQGECDSYDDDTVVCPSGFWGYRHSLGLPVSVNTAPDAPVEIVTGEKPSLAVNVSTDPNFRERPSHEQRLKSLNVGWEYADSREETIDLLKSTQSQVVYFYCHGGVTPEKVPYLSVGPVRSERFTRSLLRSKRIRWREVRPLVFINGCHTTALSPEIAIDLVSGFVENAAAAGVVGTEITIFEPIAVSFAEAFFQKFLVERQTVGDSVRAARLSMLQDGNPLGLVYIPYVMAGLRLAA